MRVIGIDPGYGRCGVAVVDKESGKEKLVFSTCIETSATQEFPDRLAAVVRECEKLIREYKPDAIALEKLFITKNQKTAMRVAEARGALISAAAQAGIPVFEYTPGEVKSASTGNGRADKEAVMKMLHALVSIREGVRHDDEYDAIAVGITHLARARGALGG
jgi:crossover junction endodeoxyribonuclease RuvC